MENFAVSESVTSISGMHRSLFHPHATLRHRIRAGPETKQTKERLQDQQQT